MIDNLTFSRIVRPLTDLWPLSPGPARATYDALKDWTEHDLTLAVSRLVQTHDTGRFPLPAQFHKAVDEARKAMPPSSPRLDYKPKAAWTPEEYVTELSMLKPTARETALELMLDGRRIMGEWYCKRVEELATAEGWWPPRGRRASGPLADPVFAACKAEPGADG